MVESRPGLDRLFGALSDATRRDILARVAAGGLSIGQLAAGYELSFAAVAKHVQVLEHAGLVQKRRRGKEQVVTIVPDTVRLARSHIDRYASVRQELFENLDTVPKEDDRHGRHDLQD